MIIAEMRDAMTAAKESLIRDPLKRRAECENWKTEMSRPPRSDVEVGVKVDG